MASSHSHNHPHAKPHEASPCDALSHAGLRNTRHRRLAYAFFLNTEQPLSAEALFLKMKTEDTALSLSTVYRLLEAFLEKGLIDKASTSEDGKSLYELASSVHRHHLRCLQCRRILVVEGCPLEGYEKELEAATHFHVTGHKLELTGYCAECMSKKRPKNQ
jgi:Fur family ferric uptake transcriptional regulator